MKLNYGAILNSHLPKCFIKISERPHFLGDFSAKGIDCSKDNSILTKILPVPQLPVGPRISNIGQTEM